MLPSAQRASARNARAREILRALADTNRAHDPMNRPPVAPVAPTAGGRYRAEKPTLDEF